VIGLCYHYMHVWPSVSNFGTKTVHFRNVLYELQATSDNAIFELLKFPPVNDTNITIILICEYFFNFLCRVVFLRTNVPSTLTS
jgi:hypothetical protein